MKNLIQPIDTFLNNYTMYKVTLFGLGGLAVLSILFGFIGLLPFSGMQFIGLLIVLIASCYLTNTLLAKLFGAITNAESALITALILFFLLAPLNNTQDLLITVAASMLAMSSKYLLAIDKKHIFNPAAIAVVILGLFGFGNAIWWVGSLNLLPFVAVVGFLMVRKIRKFYLFWPFLAVSLLTICLFNLRSNISILDSIKMAFASWPIVFFGTVMLTEPLTTPPRKNLSIIYASIVGFLFGSQYHFGPIYSSPELALVIGNLFSYFSSPKMELMLRLKKKTKIGQELYEFVFEKNQAFDFLPGQYMEWTIPPENSDIRGNRRYFTIASSPTEEEIKLGVKIGENHSSFKDHLLKLKKGATINAGQLAGDFVLPQDTTQELVFIAGGIGITPFRSMIKYLTDKNQKRKVSLFYAASCPEELAYMNIFDQAQRVGVTTIPICTKKETVPKTWAGEVGRINKEMLEKHLTNLKHKTYYLSGPNAMVEAYKQLLLDLGVSRTNIVTDYFPGF